MQKVLKPGEIFEIEIENMSHEGQGVGRKEGLVVFVEGALTGEKVIARVAEVKKRYALAKLEKIITPSPNRITPLCTYAQKCGGCALWHMTYDAELKFKKEKVEASLQRIGNVKTKVFDTIGMNDLQKYRNKAQYPVQILSGKPATGFYKKGTHDIVPIDTCLIEHDMSNLAASIVKRFITQYGISVYDEIEHKGLIRHVVTRVGFKTGEVMVIIVINGDSIPHKIELIEMLKNEIPGLKSIVLNINTKKTNVIMGKENIVIYGAPYIYDYIGDIKFAISPLSFFQVNPVQVEVLYNKTMEYAALTGKETVIDAYCGIGTITLFLSKKAKKVYGIEIVPQAIKDAKNNAEMNEIKNAQFIEGAAEKIMPELYKQGVRPEVIVMDPPRKGCDEKLLETVVNMNPDRIVYVSCNPATLARDLGYLEGRGYVTEKAQPVDMFPRTSHVECVTLMSRVEK